MSNSCLVSAPQSRGRTARKRRDDATVAGLIRVAIAVSSTSTSAAHRCPQRQLSVTTNERSAVSNLQRILKLASQALNKSGQPSTGSAGSTDWREIVRTAADKVTGDGRSKNAPPQPAPVSSTSGTPTSGGSASATDPADRKAIARYDYLLKTADPEQLELVHRDAFARLSPAQREQVEARLRADLPVHEQPASSGPDDLARAATRGEAQHPGLLRKMFASRGAGVAGAAGVGAVAGVGVGAAGGLLAAVAGGAVMSSFAAPLLQEAAGLGVDFDSFAGGVDEFAAGAGDYVGGVGEQVTGLGENVSNLGSDFEIPGLGSLGSFFDR